MKARTTTREEGVMTHDYAFIFICSCHSRLFGAESWSHQTFCLLTRKLSLVDRHFFFIRLFSRNDSCRPENVGRLGVPISVELPPFALLSVAQPARDIYISSVKAQLIAKTQVTSRAFIIMIDNNHTKRVFSGRKIPSALPANKTQSFPPAMPCCAAPPPSLPAHHAACQTTDSVPLTTTSSVAAAVRLCFATLSS